MTNRKEYHIEDLPTCLVCGFPTIDPDRICSIACRRNLTRPATAPIIRDGSTRKISHGAVGSIAANCGSMKRRINMDNQ